MENKIDTITQEKFPELEKLCPYSLEGHDKENGPCNYISQFFFFANVWIVGKIRWILGACATGFCANRYAIHLQLAIKFFNLYAVCHENSFKNDILSKTFSVSI